MKILTVIFSILFMATALTLIPVKIVYGGGAPIRPTGSAVETPEVMAQIGLRLHKIIEEIKEEQTKLESIEKELRQLEQSLNAKTQVSQDKLWMPAKIAMALNQDSK